MKTFLVMVVLAFVVCASVIADEPATVSSVYPTLSSGTLSSAVLVTLPKGIILQSGDLKFAQKDLDEAIRKYPQELWPQLKKNLFYVLENRTVDSLIAWESQSWAKSVEDAPSDEKSLIRAYIMSIASGVSVTDDELLSFYEQNKDMIGNATFDQVKNDLKIFLLDKKREKTVRSHINGLSSKYEFEVDKDWVAKQNSAAVDNPVDKARKSGMPLLVDFGADWCQPCKQMAPIIESIKKEYEGKLNVVVVHTEDEPVLSDRYGADSIPLLVFYDKDGKEFYRSTGVMSKDEIENKLAEMGVK